MDNSTKQARDNINLILTLNRVRKNGDIIMEHIPEIKAMVGFEHNHPHHHLDVWNHTLAVLDNLKDEDLELKMAGLLHDIGKPFSYKDGDVRHFHGHPEVSSKIANMILKRLEYDEEFVKNVVYLVKTHDTIIDPYNLDNTYNMVEKRLKLQYADAKAHSPSVVQKKLVVLDDIKEKLSYL